MSESANAPGPTSTAGIEKPQVSEDAKNHAILFFLDHLMAKDGTRTIHDLSCQFGSRGFSQEMRDAVGGTQESLTDFLQQYPSLFNVEGDQVTMKMFGDIATGGAKASPLLKNLQKDRDYEREAVEFFELKLNKFGPELQIKSLLGHRSQAAPEIRLVSGRHVKDFTEFLINHPESFVIEGDRIRLRNMPEPEAPAPDTDDDGQPLAGNRAKQAALEYLRAVLEKTDAPMPMETIYRHFCNRFSHRVRQDVATNPKELLYFLKLNRSVFFIRSNKVSLVRSRPGEEGSEGLDDGSIESSTPPIGSTPRSYVSDSMDTASNGSSSVGREEALDQVTIVTSVTVGITAVDEIRDLALNGIAPDTGHTSSSGGSKANSPAPPSAQGMAGLKVIAVECKYVTMGDQEFLSLVAVSTPVPGHLYVFDVAHSKLPLTETGLKDLLEASDWTKVMHDCRHISALLFKQYGIRLRNVYDTQAASAVAQLERTGRPVMESKTLPFPTLQRMYYPDSLLYSPGRGKHARRDNQYWNNRPLTDDMLMVATEEVRSLLPTIYNALVESVRPEHESLVRQLCKEYVDCYINDDDAAAQRKKRQRDSLTYAQMGVLGEKLALDTSTMENHRRPLTSALSEESGLHAAQVPVVSNAPCLMNPPAFSAAPFLMPPGFRAGLPVVTTAGLMHPHLIRGAPGLMGIGPQVSGPALNTAIPPPHGLSALSMMNQAQQVAQIYAAAAQARMNAVNAAMSRSVVSTADSVENWRRPLRSSASASSDASSPPLANGSTTGGSGTDRSEPQSQLPQDPYNYTSPAQAKLGGRRPPVAEASCQTNSTGEIGITKFFYNGES